MKKVNIFLVILIVINLMVTLFLLFGKEKKVVSNPELQIDNFEEFSKVYGGGSTVTMYKDFLRVLLEDSLPSLYIDTRELDTKQLQDYYESHKAMLTDSYSIHNYNDFNDIVENIKFYENEKIKLKKVKLKKGSCKMDKDYTEMIVEVRYTKFKKLKLNVSVINVLTKLQPTFKIKMYNGN